MNYLREVINNAALTSKLDPKYHRITSGVGTVAGIFGIAIFVYLGVTVSSAFGYEGGRPIEGVVNILLVAVFTLVLLIASVFIGFFTVAGGFSLLMLLKGEFSASEAWSYSIYGRYPSRWFGEKP